MKRLLGPIGGKPNPMLFLAPLNGSLAFQDRAGGGTLTGSGAVRYAPASGARINLVKNPRLATNSTGWAAAGVTATLTRITNDGGSTGSESAEIAASDVSQGASVVTRVPLGAQQISAKVSHVISLDIWHVAGGTDWVLRCIESDAAGNLVATGASNYITVSETKTRYAFAYTPTGTGTHMLQVQLIRASATAGTVRASCVVQETGSTTSPVPSYFDGSTGGVWLNPITGILGTAHASPSVSQAVAWVEEGTTNTVPDPSFEAATITTNWTAENAATISRVSTYADVGSNAARVSCTATDIDGITQLVTSGAAAANGQVWTIQARVRAFSSGDVGKTMRLAISERTSGDAFVRNNISSTFTLTDAWQSISYTVTLSGGGTTAKVIAKIFNGASVACDFVLDAVQLAQKAYATSYCDGSLGTGYAWSGTAHASSSTRTTTALGGALVTSARINTVRGSVALRALRRYDIGANHVVFSTGNVGVSNTDAHAINIYGTDDKIGAQWSTNSAAAQITRWGSADTPDTWSFVVADWNGTDQGITLNAGTRVAGSRAAPAGTPDTSGGLGIGDYTGGLGNNLNGYIGPVLIADRPLTAKERANLHARTSWAWGRL